MNKSLLNFAVLVALLSTVIVITTQRRVVALTDVRPAAPDQGYVVERDTDVAKDEPGPHQGLGQSTGYIFFEKVPNLKFSFRKRVLHKGASIGYHLQETDEVYYMLSGSGKMTINGKEFAVKSGDAVLTRSGSSHGLVQTGDGDLSIIITYQK